MHFSDWSFILLPSFNYLNNYKKSTLVLLLIQKNRSFYTIQLIYDAIPMKIDMCQIRSICDTHQYVYSITVEMNILKSFEDFNRNKRISIIEVKIPIIQVLRLIPHTIKIIRHNTLSIIINMKIFLFR